MLSPPQPGAHRNDSAIVDGTKNGYPECTVEIMDTHGFRTFPNIGIDC